MVIFLKNYPAFLRKIISARSLLGHIFASLEARYFRLEALQKISAWKHARLRVNSGAPYKQTDVTSH